MNLIMIKPNCLQLYTINIIFLIIEYLTTVQTLIINIYIFS